jgi:hypothetical protein
MRTSLHLDTDLKRRIVQRARAAGFKVQRGPASQLPAFLAYLIDQHYHGSPAPKAATANDAWNQFMIAVRPQMDALQSALQDFDLGLEIDFDSTRGRLSLSQAPHPDKPTRVGLSKE